MNTSLRTLAKTIACCIIAGLILFSNAERAWASNDVRLHVYSRALPGGDGSWIRPFRRITDAVTRARLIWLANTNSEIEIRVARGTYLGRYSNTDPNLEDLPIRLDVPNLKLKGSTSILLDELGLPIIGILLGSESLLKAAPPLDANQSLLIIAPTDPVLTGQGSEVSNLSFNIGNAASANRGTAISVELVQDFSIRNNYVTGGGDAGIRTRASSGEIQGNYITQVGAGTVILAGSAASPASVVFRGNRSVNNFFGGVFLNGSAITDASFDTLSAVVEDNDLSDNNANPVAGQGFGIRVVVVRHDPPNQGTSGNVTATISRNRISNNKLGFSIDAGFPYRTFEGSPDTRLHNGTVNLSLVDNEVVGNLQAPALISFTRNTATLTPSQLPLWKYLEHSTFDIADPDGNLTGYWFDHPFSDPIEGRALQNILRINGVEILNGRHVPFP